MTLAGRVVPALACLALAASASAQTAQPPARPPAQPPGQAAAPAPGQPALPFDEPTAEQTRERLRTLMRGVPPGVIEVLRLDPALLADANYMAPYPALTAFMQAHPEIIRNPRYFLGSPNTNVWESPQSEAVQRARAVRDLFQGFFLLIGFLAVAGGIAWLIRTAVEYRRWLRLTKVQTEAHTKIVDRFSSNDELMAYVQSPAGRRFLEAGPAPAEAPRSIAAPLGRILWAIQAGTVVTLLGAGLLYVSRSGPDDVWLADVSPFLFMVGTVSIAVGVGFLLSAFLSYLVSRRLGLMDHPASSNA